MKFGMAKMASDNQQNSTSVVTKEFVTELAKYFMLFLETDFKKRRQPKRNLSSRVNKGLSVGLYLDKHAVLYKELYKNFVKGFPKQTFPVGINEFVTKIPSSLKDLIEHRVNEISDDVTEQLVNLIGKEISKVRLDNQKKYDQYLEDAQDVIKASISKLITNPIIIDVEKPLTASGLSTEAGMFQLEVDSLNKVYSLLDATIENELKNFYADNSKPTQLKKYLTEQLSVKSIQAALTEFFSEFTTADAYSDIYQLHRNKEMLDKTELYIYFCEISINKFSFPLFYTPVATSQEQGSMTLETDTRVFVNTKAIEYIVQEYNLETNNREGFGSKLDRIIYVEKKEELLPKLQKIIDELSAMLDISQIDLKTHGVQSASNLFVKVNNRLQLFLFDKSDEALINDYEEIINDEGELTGAFSELIEGFISKNPERCIEEVAEEWSDLPVGDKLVVRSPIPLNEEQKQVMLALEKDDCNVVILEGPPGTGKSHTITAIVCKALLDGKSVLVLSDKEEALDVVQDKITDTLSSVRNDKNFQNPILRLGKTGGGLAKVIDGKSLDRVREHYRAYRTNADDFEILATDREHEAKLEVGRLIETASSLNLEEVAGLVEEELDFKDINWFDETDVSRKDEILLLHDALRTISVNDSSYLLEYLSELDQDGLQAYMEAIMEYENTKNSTVGSDVEFVGKYNRLIVSDKQVLKRKIRSLNSIYEQELEVLKNSPYDVSKDINAEASFSDLQALKLKLSLIKEVSQASELYLGNNKSKVASYVTQIVTYDSGITDVTSALQEYIDAVKSLKSRIFGLAGKTENLKDLYRKLKNKVPYAELTNPEKNLESLQSVVDYLTFVAQKIEQVGLTNDVWRDAIRATATPRHTTDIELECLNKLAIVGEQDIIINKPLNSLPKLLNGIQTLEVASKLQHIANQNEMINNLVEFNDTNTILSDYSELLQKLKKLKSQLDEANKLASYADLVRNFIKLDAETARRLSIDSLDREHLANNPFVSTDKKLLESYFEFLVNKNHYAKLFTDLSVDKYGEYITQLETLTAAKMAHLLDDRIINYVDNHASDLRSLKSILSSKQKFPKSLFGDLKKAFPCIIAGIRDYATYIPLEKNLFDLVIIDEASQVSIAQALPALIRGQKILVLGDDKQFSNVKAGNASKLTNDQMKSQVLNELKNAVASIDDDHARMFMSKAKNNFDIKNSVLEFCRFISNYEIMLKKHFRCYPEIIAFSNENYYGGELQCMKARALPIGEVIKFEQIKHDGRQEQYYNTNTPEAEFILDEMKRMKERGFSGSLGVITPHREQASLAQSILLNSELSAWLKDRRLKVMTFDTCQGEERDYIFYSMVASLEDDKHRYVFPQTLLEKSGDEEAGVRKQRLNVGFSRSKETIHFILSKPIEDYWGSIKEALLFYKNKLESSVGIQVGGTDIRSGMEKKVQHYFYETDFYKKNSDKVELLPQFPLGEYLKSLSRNYTHPSYKVDFLLVYDNLKVVVEYDGFKEHFVDAEGINKHNFMSYLKEEDIYRQKVLEGYGYRFIRLNKFNLGNNPIESFNDLLVNSVKKKTSSRQLLTST